MNNGLDLVVQFCPQPSCCSSLCSGGLPNLTSGFGGLGGCEGGGIDEIGKPPVLCKPSNQRIQLHACSASFTPCSFESQTMDIHIVGIRRNFSILTISSIVFSHCFLRGEELDLLVLRMKSHMRFWLLRHQCICTGSAELSFGLEPGGHCTESNICVQTPLAGKTLLFMTKGEDTCTCLMDSVCNRSRTRCLLSYTRSFNHYFNQSRRQKAKYIFRVH